MNQDPDLPSSHLLFLSRLRLVSTTSLQRNQRKTWKHLHRHCNPCLAASAEENHLRDRLKLDLLEPQLAHKEILCSRTMVWHLLRGDHTARKFPMESVVWNHECLSFVGPGRSSRARRWASQSLLGRGNVLGSKIDKITGNERMVYMVIRECTRLAHWYAVIFPYAMIDNDSNRSDKLFGKFDGTCNCVPPMIG